MTRGQGVESAPPLTELERPHHSTTVCTRVHSAADPGSCRRLNQTAPASLTVRDVRAMVQATHFIGHHLRWVGEYARRGHPTVVGTAQPGRLGLANSLTDCPPLNHSAHRGPPGQTPGSCGRLNHTAPASLTVRDIGAMAQETHFIGPLPRWVGEYAQGGHPLVADTAPPGHVGPAHPERPPRGQTVCKDNSDPAPRPPGDGG